MNAGTARIAVVGAGVIGAAVARELAVRGARVWLLDKDDRAEGTTAISFAWLNAHRKRGPGYHRLNVAGMAEHRALVARLGSLRRWHFPVGHLEYATDPAHAAAMERDVAELRALGYPAVERRLAGILRAGRVPVRVESAIVGKRALPADGHTIAGFLDERQAVYAVVTHSGITLGPLLGRLVAEELLEGHSSGLLADFRPDRFGAR